VKPKIPPASAPRPRGALPSLQPAAPQAKTPTTTSPPPKVVPNPVAAVESGSDDDSSESSGIVFEEESASGSGVPAAIAASVLGAAVTSPTARPTAAQAPAQGPSSQHPTSDAPHHRESPPPLEKSHTQAPVPVKDSQTPEQTSPVAKPPRPLPRSTPRHEDDLEDDLVHKVLQRVENRETRTSRNASRAATPVRQQSETRANTSSHTENTQVALLEASRDRLVRENVRLNDELAWLSREYEKSRQATDRALLLERDNAKLDSELNVLKRKHDELLREHSRYKSSSEAKTKALQDHATQLEEEVRTSRSTVAHFEAQLHDKERALSSEVAQNAALKADLRDLSHDLKLARDDAMRQRDEDHARIEQVSGMLADAKKQRVVLLDLNDKCSRDKETADAERRRAEDALRITQAQLQAERERCEKEVQHLMSRLDTTHHQTSAREAELARRITELETHLRDREARLTTAEDRTRDRDTAVHMAVESERQKLHGQLEHEQRRSNDAEARLRECHEELQGLRRQLNDANTKLATLESRREDETSSTAELARLRPRVSDLETHLKDANGEIGALCRRLDEETALRIEAEEHALRAKARFSSLRDAMDKLLASDDQLSQENESLHRKVAELDSAVDRLTVENRNALAHSSLLRELQVENERLQLQASRAHSERADLARELERLQSELRSSWRTDASIVSRTPSSVPRVSRGDFSY
jgi:chromosome segregation ATPase